MRRKKSIFIFTLLFIIATTGVKNKHFKNKLFGKNKIQKIDGKAVKKNEKKKILKLNVNKVIDYLLKNNNDVKLALLDYKGASSELMSFRSKYDFNLNGSANYSVRDNPNATTQVYLGKSTTTGVYNAGISKIFRTGTTIKTGITGFYENVRGAGFPGVDFGGVGYQTGITVEVKQELLKNFFGYADRLSEQKIQNNEKIKKQLVKRRLAELLVDALVGYWNVAIAQENQETGKIDLNSTRNIQNLIRRKLRLGLSEREDILDWNGKVLVGMNNYERAGKVLFDARLAVLRILNLDPGLQIEIGKTFKKEAPEITFEHAIKDAFLKRTDWNNQLVILKNAELEYKIASSDLLPSLTLNLSAGQQDYDRNSYLNTIDDYNKQLSIGAELTYPLENTEANVKMRNARLELQREAVEKNELEKKIKDEIVSLIKECEVSYKVYKQTLQAKGFARNYYFQVLRKFKRGRYDALQLKLALDGFIRSRRDELKSLVDYNVALLKRDLSRNMIFENFGIDINGLLKSVEN